MMKGFIIFEDFKKLINCKEILDGDYNCVISDYPNGTFGGIINRVTGARCNKDDTYDFETGALIALMKMCGVEKVVRACNEAFSYETDIKVLRKDNNNLREANKGLQEEVKRLKGESESHWKIYQRNIQKKQDRINELERAYKASNDDEAKLVEYYQREIKKLEAENEKLKLDCEKLQHGYNDMIFCGGRACGKQYKALVELFKKIPKDKVEDAYKEAYNTVVPVWQKEFLKQMCDIHKESKEKTELPRTLDINGTTYRKEISLKDLSKIFCPEELKVPTKREKMWENILKEGRSPVYVKREDVHDFLKECQVMGIKWATGKMPLETMPFHMSKGYDGIYFFVMTSLDITKSTSGTKEFRHVMCWWMTASDEEARNSIKYLPPMRWDLFEKGRIVIKVEKESYGEFCSRMLSHFDKVGVNAFNHACKFGYFAFNKDTNYVERIMVSDNGDAKEINRRKVVEWEDVR